MGEELLPTSGPAVGFLGCTAVRIHLPMLEIQDMGLIPGSGRSPGGGNGNQLPLFLPGNSMDRGAWQATVQGAVKSQTQLSD